MSFDLDDEELKATREMKCNQKNYKFKEKAMSDEEKKEYEEAKLYLTHTGLDDFNLEKYQSENRIWAIQIILNLIEKQSKEIEELKEKTKKCEYYEMVADELYKNSVSKDKIKAKIEEINKKSFKNDINYSEFYYKKEVLQSLLQEG